VFWVLGLGFGVWGLGFGVWGLGFRDWSLGCGVWDLVFGLWVLGLVFGVGAGCLGCSVKGVGVQVLWFIDSGLGFRV